MSKCAFLARTPQLLRFPVAVVAGVRVSAWACGGELLGGRVSLARGSTATASEGEYALSLLLSGEGATALAQVLATNNNNHQSYRKVAHVHSWLELERGLLLLVASAGV